MSRLYLLALALLLGLPTFASTKLEVSVVVDKSTADKYGPDLNKMVDEAFVTAGDIYQRELQISIVMTRLDVANDIPGHTRAEALTDAFYTWRQAHPEHLAADATVLLTSRDLIGYVGYSDGIGTMCSGNAVAVVELLQDHLAGYTLAHELGHILGAPHDGVEECTAEPKTGYVMGEVVRPVTTFSSCSKELIKRRVEALGSCMIEKPATPPPQGPTAGLQTGGGGAFDWLTAAGLLGLLAFRRKHAQA